MADSVDKMKKRKEELDDFWSFDDLLPKRKQSSSQGVDYKRAVPVEVSAEPKKETAVGTNKTLYSDVPISPRKEENGAGRHYVSLSDAPSTVRRAPEPESEYAPESSLIHKVRIYRWESNYNYYERFRLCAEKFIAIEGKPAPHVPFFSYVPQYNQLNRAQLEFYFWWRTCVRRGEFFDADYSYILLYAYETVNLSGEHDYMSLRDTFFGVWMAYRARYPRLDAILGDWIFDFCMIHRLPPPKGKIPLGAIGKSCGTAEFFVSAVGSDSSKYVSALLEYCTSYDYRKSKFYEGEHAAIYDRYIKRALLACLMHLSKDGRVLGSLSYGDSKASREAYTGALCSCTAKRRIEIEFCSFSRSHELRYLVGDIVKYAENIIRSYIGVKSRLTVFSVPSELEEIIKVTLKNELPPKTRASARREETHAFDKLYEPPKKEFSFADAKRIENESWETTRLLVEAFDEKDNAADIEPIVYDEEKTENIIEPASQTQKSETQTFGEFSGYLLALLDGDGEAKRKELARLARSEEVIADRINEIAADVIGDIVIEEGESGDLEIIEDYRDTLCEIFSITED